MPRLITIQLIESNRNIGLGTQESPVRTLEEYHSPDGELVASYDPTTEHEEFNYSGFQRLIKSQNEYD